MFKFLILESDWLANAVDFPVKKKQITRSQILKTVSKLPVQYTAHAIHGTHTWHTYMYAHLYILCSTCAFYLPRIHSMQYMYT